MLSSKPSPEEQGYHLREIHEMDAAALLDLFRSMEDDSPFVLLDAGERTTSISEQREEIRSILAQDNQMMWVIENGPELVAWLGAWGERYRRVRHSVLIGVGVRKGYRRKGLGAALFTQLEKWARKHGISRLELVVAVENVPAIALYEKMGFEIEGVKRKSYRIGTERVDEYLMAKLLGR